MKFNVVTKEGSRQEEMVLKNLLVVGFAGKDIEKQWNISMNWKKLVLNARAKYRCFISAKNKFLPKKTRLKLSAIKPVVKLNILF